VSAGLVAFALGTDVAGSGRVPASFTNIVGLKPTRGLISTEGVVPACRTLDCISVFALTVADAVTVLRVAAAPADNPYSRFREIGTVERPAAFRFALPRPDQREFFGDEAARAGYDTSIARLIAMGGTPVEIDYAPWLATARLLYEGPWVAERYLVARAVHTAQPDALHPVTREILETGMRASAADAFEGFYRLDALRASIAPVRRDVDLLMVPTTGTIYTVAEVEADPIRLNSNLGIYTNFVNLLDLAALAVPGGFRPNGTSFGITLIAPAFSDAMLAALGAELHARAGVPMGATGVALPA
jgi:allophanate hydrolase